MDTVESLGAAKWIEAAGIRTRYFESGRGAPIVFIHGGEIGSPEGSSLHWLECFARSSDDFRVLAFDRLGMGHTGIPLRDEDYTLAASSAHARDFINAVVAQPVHLVAHGSGARIALDLCLAAEISVASCSILNSATVTPGVMEIVPRRHSSDTWEAGPRAREHYRSLCAIHSRIRPLLFHEARALAELDGMKRAHAKMWNDGLRTRIYLRDLVAGRAMIFKRLPEQGVACPMMLINGVDDPLVDADRAALLVSALTEKQNDVELHLLAGCGHYPQLEKSEIVAGIITGFVHQHATASSVTVR